MTIPILILINNLLVIILSSFGGYQLSSYHNQKSVNVLLTGLWQRGYLKKEVFDVSQAEAEAIFKSGWMWLERNNG